MMTALSATHLFHLKQKCSNGYSHTARKARDKKLLSPVLTVPAGSGAAGCEPARPIWNLTGVRSLVRGPLAAVTPAPILSAVPKWGFIGPLLRLQVAVARGTTAAEGLSIGRNPTLEFLGGETAACLLNISQPPIEIPFLIVRITKRSGPTMGWSCTPW
ncbi:hypothetical protein EYZ11_013097 [Aspergillus tanneri]|uniref:Uncharacterized protein n=1 Tax=Aspergillus tanneri TaxID=1220188 RepID=A0A4S3J0P9_9EURO|nr:hypothetical protein EYZ11_013097 [Aspergillus tanneri]